MVARELPVWRSLLFVPVNVPRFVEKAHLRGADVIMLDLEDSIAPSEKENARRMIQDAVRKVSRNGAEVAVRINAPLSLAVRDLEEAISPLVTAVNLPKIESGAQIELLSDCVAELESARGMRIGSTRFKVIIETAKGFMALQDISRAIQLEPRVAAMTLGSEDFSLSSGMVPEPDSLYVPNVLTVVAARAAGVLPLGFVGSVADISDLAGFRQILKRSKNLGFVGASCVHPSQVPVLNEEYGISDGEAERARRIVTAARVELTAGRAAFELDGSMVDIPVVRRAEQVLQRYEAIKARGRQAC